MVTITGKSWDGGVSTIDLIPLTVHSQQLHNASGKAEWKTTPAAQSAGASHPDLWHTCKRAQSLRFEPRPLHDTFDSNVSLVFLLYSTIYNLITA